MPKNPTKYIVLNANECEVFDDLTQFDTELAAHEALAEALDNDVDVDDLHLYKIQELNFTTRRLVTPKEED